MPDLATIGFAMFAFVGWILYLGERRRSRDYATDLSQVIHDYPEVTDSLRRSLNHAEIRERVDDE